MGVGKMGNSIATVIVEPRSLVREALVSLMEGSSYHVVCSVASVGDIERSAFKEVQPKLVILGALPAERVAEIASSIRSCWQDVKIIMLFEEASSRDLQNLLASGLDACIPTSASPRTLTDALQLIVCEQLRVLMVSGSAILDPSTDPQPNDEDGSEQAGRPRIASVMPSLPGSGVPDAGDLLAKSPFDGAARGGRVPGLSERENQILKELVRGHSNKVIARMFSLTEATVKVHMKSILRKIRVANRTQAAIWALRNAYCADVSETMPKGMQAAASASSYT
jgi:two-component system nitrate/nitrite response regulator NarL